MSLIDNIKKQHILVTGGTGMVGTYLQELVQNKKDDLYEWIFLSSKDCNLTMKEQVMQCFEQYQPIYVIHLAANVGGLYKNMQYPVEMFSENMLMNEHVLMACHQYNVQKAIFCLSTCIFPAEPSSYPITEEMLFESPPHPSNASYAYAKRMLKLQCDNYNQQYGRQYICLSPVNLYGLYDNFHLEDSHVIPGMIHRMYQSFLENKPYISYGSGKPLRQFLYARDFAEIIYRILLEYQGTDMMICAPEKEYSIQELETMIQTNIQSYFPGCLLDIQKDTSKSDGIYKKTASNINLKACVPNLHFVSLEDGLRKTIDWFIQEYSSSVRK
jgi:GDP-L-fucose synthase